MNKKRYQFTSDDAGHHYLIPEDEMDLFGEWLDLHETGNVEGIRAWTGPDFNRYMCGSLWNYTFTDPQEF